MGSGLQLPDCAELALERRASTSHLGMHCAGEAPYPWMKEGRDVVRIFNRVTNKWRTLPGVKLSEYRWYPTQVGGAGGRPGWGRVGVVGWLGGLEGRASCLGIRTGLEWLSRCMCAGVLAADGPA
jgi:hypothetical protein